MIFEEMVRELEVTVENKFVLQSRLDEMKTIVKNMLDPALSGESSARDAMGLTEDGEEILDGDTAYIIQDEEGEWFLISSEAFETRPWYYLYDYPKAKSVELSVVMGETSPEKIIDKLLAKGTIGFVTFFDETDYGKVAEAYEKYRMSFPENYMARC